MATPLTPLLPYWSGLAQANTDWYSWTVPANLDITRYRLTARDAPTGSSLTVQIRKNGTTQQTITLTSGSTDTGYTNQTISFSQGDVMLFRIATIGSTNEGSGLQLSVDVSATDYTEARPTQTPYLVEQEGLISVGTIFTYTLARTVSMKSAQFTLRGAPTGSSAIVTISHTNTLGTTTVATLTIAANNLDSGVTVLSETFYPGDIITVAVTQIGSTSAGSGLAVAMDYDILDLVNELVGQYYSEPDNELIQFLKQIGIGAARADTLTTDDLVTYKKRANEIIDSRLAAVYRTPLHTITRNLKTTYPEPIAQIAQRIVGYMLVNDVFSEVEPNASSNAERHYKMAMEDLDSIATRRTLLKGQRYRSRNYGSNPYTEPLSPFSGAAIVPGSTPLIS